MQQSIEIVLTFINNASAGLEAAAASTRSALQGLGSASAAAGSQMSTMWEETGGRVTASIGKIIEQSKLASLIIGGGLVKGLTDLVGMAGDFERFGKAAEYLTGSTKAANEFAHSVRGMANDTMFNIDQIAKLDTLLIGNTKNVKQSEGALRALSEGVAATGGSYSELEGATRAWVQTNSKAKASSEELNRQFANANIPIIRVLSEHIVKDLNSPLRKYIETAGDGDGAAGVSKKLATAYAGASDKVGILGERLKLAQMTQESYTKSSKKTEIGELSKKIAVESAQKAFDKATGTINQYNDANKATVVHGSAAKLTIEGVMAQLQKVGDLNIPGTVMSAEITKALNEAYGGANKNLINTFSGQMSLLGDVFKQVGLSVMGLDDNFRPVKGGILDLLSSALRPLVSYLQNNQAKIQEWAAEWSKSTPVLMAVSGIILGIVIPAITGILGPLLLLGGVFGGLGYAIGKAIDANGGFAKTLQDTGNIWGTVYPVLQTIFNIFLNVADAISKNAQLMSALKGAAAALAIVLGASGLVSILGALRVAVIGLMGVFSPWMLLILAVGAVVGMLITQWDELKQSGSGMQTVLLLISGAVIALTTAWTALNIVFALSPIGMLTIALGLLVAGIVALANNTDMLKTKQDLVTQAHKNVADAAHAQWQAYKDLQDSIKQLHDAEFDLEGAQLRLEHAQRNLTDVTKRYGDQSLEAKDARHELKGAEDAVHDAMDNVNKKIDDSKKKQDEHIKKTQEVVRAQDELKKKNDEVETTFGNIINKITEAIDKLGKWNAKIMGGTGGSIGIGTPGLHFAHGGIVPGAIGQAVPIIAHGGERVVTAGSTDVNGGGGGAGSTVNFYGNLTVDSDERVQQLADQISKILGRQNELARYGAGY